MGTVARRRSHYSRQESPRSRSAVLVSIGALLVSLAALAVSVITFYYNFLFQEDHVAAIIHEVPNLVFRDSEIVLSGQVRITFINRGYRSAIIQRVGLLVNDEPVPEPQLDKESLPKRGLAICRQKFSTIIRLDVEPFVLKSSDIAIRKFEMKQSIRQSSWETDSNKNGEIAIRRNPLSKKYPDRYPATVCATFVLSTPDLLNVSAVVPLFDSDPVGQSRGLRVSFRPILLLRRTVSMWSKVPKDEGIGIVPAELFEHPLLKPLISE